MNERMALFGLKRVEDPVRLEHFLAALRALSWENSQKSALLGIFDALDELAYQEVRYYYAARVLHRRVSFFTRALAFAFGSLGLLVPLLAAANPKLLGWMSPYGYLLLAASAAALAANRLFGATGGHIRFVSTQLELEQLLTGFRLERISWLAKHEAEKLSKEGTHEALQLFRNFVERFYRVLRSETTVWGRSISEALREFGDGPSKGAHNGAKAEPRPSV